MHRGSSLLLVRRCGPQRVPNNVKASSYAPSAARPVQAVACGYQVPSNARAQSTVLVRPSVYPAIAGHSAFGSPRFASAQVSASAPVAAGAELLIGRIHALQQPTAEELAKETFTDPAAAGQLLFTPGLLWKAVQQDAAAAGESPDAYLTRVEETLASFFDTVEEDGLPRVINHEATLAALATLGRVTGKGLLQLLTGPRSVGKSLMLRKIAAMLKAKKRCVLVIDARQYGSDLVRGIAAALTVDQTLLQAVLKVAPSAVASGISTLISAFIPAIGPLVESGVKAMVDATAERSRDGHSAELRTDLVLGAFFSACKQRGEYPVIIIDEANKAFAATDAAAGKRTLDLLDLLTRVTKQEKEASVVLATSEHGLPFRLRALGYNTDHISKTIVAEEVPPAVMRELLVKTWGCGQHLASTLLAMYGGHLLHASAAVRELAVDRDMEGNSALGSVISAPSRCLSVSTLASAGVMDREQAEICKRVVAVLHALAVDGFVPLAAEDDKVAEVISLANAGCVVPRGASAACVPSTAWATRTLSGETPTHMLVPSSHIMRLLIANKTITSPASNA